MREIAVHLKNCMKERTKDNVHKIYNWQFLNCIRLWFAVIGAYPGMDDLGKLAHPLIEISFGILKFYPHPRYAPLRIHMLSYLDEFSFKSSIYIPTMHYYFEIMKEANVNKKRDRTFTKAYDFPINVKVQKMYLKANLYYHELFQLALTRMTHSLSNLAHYISYPESIVVVKNLLRKFVKETKSKELRDELKKTLELIEQNAKVYEGKRKEMKITDDKNIDPLTSKLLHSKSYQIIDYLVGGLRGLSLVKLSEKLRKENEEYIKQNILSEQEKFYAEEKEKAEGKDGEIEDEDQEGEDGEGDYDDGEDIDGEDGYDDEDGDEGDDGQFDDE
jgi:nucleolar complex protein 2